MTLDDLSKQNEKCIISTNILSDLAKKIHLMESKGVYNLEKHHG
jgi:hypothetical protein